MTTAPKKGGIPTWVWILIALFVLLPVLGALLLIVLGMGAGALTYSRLNDARLDSAGIDAQTVQSAAMLHLVENPGASCVTVGDLVTSGALDARYERDPWQHEWSIECAGDDITVTSRGPDGQLGTGDDVSSE